MIHQAGVLRDGPAEIGKIMRVGMMTVKAEGEDRQPDIARIACAIDDLGAGQHQAGQAQIRIVARHLVDDARLIGRERVQLGQILHGGGVEGVGIEACNARDRCGVLMPAAQRRESARQRHALAGAMHVAMRG